MTRFQHLLSSLCTFLVASVLLAAAARAAEAPPKPGDLLVYVGTYTEKTSKGIYVLGMNPVTGELGAPRLAAESRSPSFLALHPNRHYLYAVNEVSDFNNKKLGAVSAFNINADGTLVPIDVQPSGGDGPCDLTVDREGKGVLVANYGSGTAAWLPTGRNFGVMPPAYIDQHQGKSANPERQEGPHAHCAVIDPSGRFALVNDLGLDKIFVYRIDNGKIAPNEPPALKVKDGSGPRHLAFHPNGRYAYVINEMASTVTAFTFDPQRGALTEIESYSTLPQDFKGENTTAEVAVHPSGKFLYGSNRGHDSLAIFTIDQDTGKLTPAGHQPTGGKTPRSFGIDPSGRFLLAANQNSDSVIVFAIDTTTGGLHATGARAEVGMPCCVKFLPAEAATR